MTKLGRAIVEAMVIEYGRAEVLKRLSDPLWFQSFGAVLGMDWHSSGITTSVMGALKAGLNPISSDLGIYICGGRGKNSLKTPSELIRVGETTGLDGLALAQKSRLSAKIDNTAVQDGFQIYLHSFVVSKEGEWAVVQQGLDDSSGYARRYHWHSDHIKSFVDEPHTAVCGDNRGDILNLVHHSAQSTRKGTVTVANQHPTKAIQEIRKIRLPEHHEVRLTDLDLKRLGAVITLAYESDITEFEHLLLQKGVGPRTLQSLVLVSEVVHGTPSRFTDPARFSFAHGGKDGHPFPVPLKVYDEVIESLNRDIAKAKMEHSEKTAAFKKLHQLAINMEDQFKPDPYKYQELVDREWENSPEYGGRTVFDDNSRRKSKSNSNKEKKNPGQLSLFS